MGTKHKQSMRTKSKGNRYASKDRRHRPAWKLDPMRILGEGENRREGRKA